MAARLRPAWESAPAVPVGHGTSPYALPPRRRPATAPASCFDVLERHAVHTRRPALLYDLTSVYFEGAAAANPLERRGYSREDRPDCKQVCLALVVTRDGMPLGYQVFAGIWTDVTTVEDIVEAMEAGDGMAQRIWVMDLGMTSADNLECLRQTGRRYLVGTPKGEIKKCAGALAEARD